VTAVVGAILVATTAFAARSIGQSQREGISVRRLVLTDSAGNPGAVLEMHGRVLRIWLSQASDSMRPTGIELAPAPSLALTKRGAVVYEINPTNGLRSATNRTR